MTGKNYFESKHLVGNYAGNCAGPPTPSNEYMVFRTSDANAVQLDIMRSNEERRSVWLLDNVAELSPDTFTATLSQAQDTSDPAAASRVRATFRIDVGRLRIMDWIGSDGKIAVKDGRQFPNGRPAGWLTKCEPGVPRTILGARLSWTTADTALRYDLGDFEGALVQEVFAGTPAQGAGLQFGDIILAYNGVPLTSTFDLTTRVAIANPGDKTTLTIARERQLKQIDYVAAARSPDIRFPSAKESADLRGLSGRFAHACNAKTSPTNTLVTFSSNQAGELVLDVRDAPNHVEQSFVVREVHAQYPSETGLTLTYPNGSGKWVLRIDSGKFRFIDILYGSKYSFRDGHDIATGRETGWLQKCN